MPCQLPVTRFVLKIKFQFKIIQKEIKNVIHSGKINSFIKTSQKKFHSFSLKESQKNSFIFIKRIAINFFHFHKKNRKKFLSFLLKESQKKFNSFSLKESQKNSFIFIKRIAKKFIHFHKKNRNKFHSFS